MQISFCVQLVLGCGGPEGERREPSEKKGVCKSSIVSLVSKDRVSRRSLETRRLASGQRREEKQRSQLEEYLCVFEEHANVAKEG